MTAIAANRCGQHSQNAGAVPFDIPRCETYGTHTYGLWDDIAGGFIYAGDCATEVGAEGHARLTDSAHDEHDPDAEFSVQRICAEHPEQPAGTCGDCHC